MTYPAQFLPGPAPHITGGRRGRPDQPAPGLPGLVVLFDPTPRREETARRLADAGDWQIVALDSNQVETFGPAVEELAMTTGGRGKAAQARLRAVVLEAAHPLYSEPTLDRPPLRAEQLLDWLESRWRLDGAAKVLYTADPSALAQARQDWDVARRSGRYRLARFSATVQRDPATQSDLALAQLLERLVDVVS